ncbi:MAG: lipid-A-disaccharide synthase [Acidobacteriota bacterium]
MTRVMLSCGEPSGDLYAGALVESLAAREPTIDVFGLGGPRFAAAGARLIADYRGLAVTGLTEALRVLPQSYAVYRQLVEAARRERPDVLVLIDYPDFNFRLMSAVRKLGVPIAYYVSPQLWAWRRGRIRAMKASVDLVLPIFPFEAAMYEAEGIPVTFVGHPLVDLAVARRDRASLLAELGLDARRRIVGVLPGSRPNELHRHVPVLAAALPRIQSDVPDAAFLVARAPELADALFAPFHGIGVDIRLVEGRTDDVLAASDAVVTASGTATVQTALHGTPMVVVYKLSPMTYRLGRPLVRVDMFSMVNLVAGRRVVPELIQDECTPERVAAEITALLAPGDLRERMIGDLAAVREKFGGPGASGRAADAVLALTRSTHAAQVAP